LRYETLSRRPMPTIALVPDVLEQGGCQGDAWYVLITEAGCGVRFTPDADVRQREADPAGRACC